MTLTLQKTKNNWIVLRTLALGVFFVFLLVYGVLHFRLWWQGPRLVVTTPFPGGESSVSVVRVRGKAEGFARVFVNGLIIPLSLRENTFVTEVPLPEGYSTINVTAQTRSGKSITKIIPIVYRNTPLIGPYTQFLTPSDLGFLEVNSKN
jgi:hypothetical protein